MAAEEEKSGEDSQGLLGHLVRLGLMIWACGVITANYMGMFKQSIDVTFSASLLSSMAASYGLTVGRNGQKKKEQPSLEQTSKPKQ